LFEVIILNMRLHHICALAPFQETLLQVIDSGDFVILIGEKNGGIEEINYAGVVGGFIFFLQTFNPFGVGIMAWRKLQFCQNRWS